MKGREIYLLNIIVSAFQIFKTLALTTVLFQVPHYQRGGTIVPRRFRVRRSSALTHEDPYTLIVALGINVCTV